MAGQPPQDRLQEPEAHLEPLEIHHQGAQRDQAQDRLPADEGEGPEDRHRGDRLREQVRDRTPT